MKRERNVFNMECGNTFIENLIIKGVPANEVETIVTFTKLEDEAIIYTTDNTVLTRLKKNMKSNPNEWKFVRFFKQSTNDCIGEVVGVEISCPKKYISFRSSNHKISEEQKKKASERFKKMWEEKNK